MLSTILVSVISTLMALDTLVLVWIAARGRRFLRRHPRLEDDEDFTEYRRLVIACMKLTFSFIILFNSAVLICCLGTALAWIRVPDLESAALIGIIRLLATAMIGVNVEGQLKNIPTTGPRLFALKKELITLWDAEMWPRRACLVGTESLAEI